MRWQTKTPKEGETRIVKQFLLLPKKIKGQTRWWEKAKVVQKYIVPPLSEGVWIDWDWVSVLQHPRDIFVTPLSDINEIRRKVRDQPY